VFLRENHDRHRAVLRVSRLTIEERMIVAIMGPTGCGKTTLLKLLCGLDQPSIPGSRIDLFGDSPQTLRRTGQMNFSFQAPVLLPWLTVRDNVLLPLALRGQPVEQAEQIAANRAISMVRLDHNVADFYPDRLSSGMASRVAVAQAVTSGCRILMMDEVFGTLDEVTRVELDIKLREINESDMQATILFVTHSIEEAVLLADRVIILDTLPDDCSGESIAVDLPIALNTRDSSVRYTSEFRRYKELIEMSFPRHNRAGVRQ